MKIKTSKFFTFAAGFLLFLSSLSALAVFRPTTTSAVSPSDWQAGNIISDLVFTNSNSMSVGQIQNFLNSQVPNCDTNGTQRATEYGRSDLTHAQYATQVRGWPGPPYVCLRNYYEVPKTSPAAGMPDNSYNHGGNPPAGSLSAAQMIYNAAQQYRINPKVLLVKIKAESGGPLTNDSWPLQSQYTYAMGAHCPDSGPNNSANCDPNYAGFSIQISEAAALMRYYLDNMSQPWWPYKKPGNNTILYNPSTSCGSSVVNIVSKATAALYTYTPYQPNAGALAAGYGTAPCGAYGNRNFWLYYNDWFGSTLNEATVVSYQSYLNGRGWTGIGNNSGISGTVGEGRAMQAFKFYGDINYSSYNSTTGWQPTVSNGTISGTVDQGKAIQALRINPGSSMSGQYDIWYRAQISNIGWMGWAKNGETAGVTGSNNTIEAFEVYVANKDSGAPGSSDGAYQNNGVVSYNPALSLSASSQVQNIGWQPQVSDGMVIGTIDQRLRIEALKLNVNNNTGLNGGIAYQSQVQNIGWQNPVADGAISGTVGQSLRTEAVKIALTGQLGDNYDIWYRPLVENIGWMGWAKNGQPAGSVGAYLRLEALEIRLTPKGTPPLPNQNYLYNPQNTPISDNYALNYSAHVSTIGWMQSVPQNMISGTTGQGKPMEALRFDANSSLLGDLTINCSAYVKDTGWSATTSTGGTCGTTGQNKPISALKLNLSGSAAGKYDVSYRVHLSNLGWQNWTTNGDTAGIPAGNNIEAVAVRLIQK